ncbi:MAG TPA: hypothetical protein VEK08_07880 [Planctomycetota bacterium]|nr:hypothetical protein [Planctomycetota bacterium]
MGANIYQMAALALTLLFIVNASCGELANGELPSPFLFSLGGLTQTEIEELARVPGVEGVRQVGERHEFVWQPFNDQPWTGGFDNKWVKGAEGIYRFLKIEGVVGKTRWTHGGKTSSVSGRILRLRSRVCFSFMFNDASTKRNEIMILQCYTGATREDVEHDMLCGVPGTKWSVERCGNGNVIVSRSSWGTFVVWQVSDQMYVRIDNSYDKEMVEAYVNRFGSMIPADYKVDLDDWVQFEISGRIRFLNEALNVPDDRKVDRFLMEQRFLGPNFPDIQWRYGWLKGTEDLTKVLEWRKNAIYFLWANRSNFDYDDRTRGYLLKGTKWTAKGRVAGKDLYDPNNPPLLPDNLVDRGPHTRQPLNPNP